MRRRRKKQSRAKSIINSLVSLSNTQAISLKSTEKSMRDTKTELEATLESLDSAEQNGKMTNNILRVVSVYLFLKLLGVNFME